MANEEKEKDKIEINVKFQENGNSFQTIIEDIITKKYQEKYIMGWKLYLYTLEYY